MTLTARIVAAHVSGNAVPADSLPALIRSVHQALAEADSAPPQARPEPAVPINRSVFNDHIICLEDGRKLAMLKRHLATRYKMTPAQYREKWGLRPDYPMVAPGYAKRRSALAIKIGLGRKPAAAQEAAPPPAATAKPGRRRQKRAAPARRRGRSKA
jgi:predicted transcriptional regulator